MRQNFRSGKWSVSIDVPMISRCSGRASASSSRAGYAPLGPSARARRRRGCPVDAATLSSVLLLLGRQLRGARAPAPAGKRLTEPCGRVCFAASQSSPRRRAVAATPPSARRSRRANRPPRSSAATAPRRRASSDLTDAVARAGRRHLRRHLLDGSRVDLPGTCRTRPTPPAPLRPEAARPSTSESARCNRCRRRTTA